MTSKVIANDNESDNSLLHTHTPNQHILPFYSTYASQLKDEQNRHSLNGMTYSNDAEGYYDDEHRFYSIPYQEENEVFQDIPSNHSLSQSSQSNHSQNKQSKKEAPKHRVLKVRMMMK